MGQKVNPHGMRVGINAGWEATWYADKKDFAAFIKEDDVVRKYIKKTYYSSAISKISLREARVNWLLTSLPVVPARLSASRAQVSKK